MALSAFALFHGSGRRLPHREPSPASVPGTRLRSRECRNEPNLRPTSPLATPGSSTPAAREDAAAGALAPAPAVADVLDDHDPCLDPQGRVGNLVVATRPRRHSPNLVTSVRTCQGVIVGIRRAASMNAATFSGSLIPGDDSTPLATSTIQGRTSATRSATFSGVNPPARIKRL
jgi:hypothetical protein